MAKKLKRKRTCKSEHPQFTGRQEVLQEGGELEASRNTARKWGAVAGEEHIQVDRYGCEQSLGLHEVRHGHDLASGVTNMDSSVRDCMKITKVRMLAVSAQVRSAVEPALQ